MPSDNDVPRWREELSRSIRPVVYAVAISLLTNSLSLPRPVGIVVILVVAVVYGFDRLNKSTELARRLPNVLLCAGVGGVVLAVTTPESWHGPLTVVAVVLIACATLVTDDRAAALTALVGIGVITAGVEIIVGGLRDPENHGRPLTTVLGGWAVVLGLGALALRRRLFTAKGGFTRAELREYKVGWARGSALSFAGVFGSVQFAHTGHVLAAVLAAIASLSWFAVAAVFIGTFPGTDRQDSVAGAMLMLTGVCVTGLGLLAFDAHQFIVGLIATTLGIAMAGGGLSLLESTGLLGRLRTEYLDDRAGGT